MKPTPDHRIEGSLSHMNPTRQVVLAQLTMGLAIAVLAGGCAPAGSRTEHRPLTPADFANPLTQAPPPATVPPAEPSQEELKPPLPAEELPSAALATPPGRRDLVLDAMVGQVNGHPIYTNTVFDPIEQQMVRLGQDLPRLEFRQQVEALVISQLRRIVTERLLLGEAERDLSEQEQQALRNVLKELREQTIRQFGQGVSGLADQRLRREANQTLDEKMEETRQGLLIERFIARKLYPKIHVSRRDVDRYYRTHKDLYHTPPGRLLRMIAVTNSREADLIDQQLAEAVPFAKVATGKINRYKPDQGGLFDEKPVPGNQIFANEQLNQALVNLEPGEHSPRIEIGRQYRWVFLEAKTEAQGKSLRDVQLTIHRELRRQQRQELTREYERQLFARGSFDPIEDMAATLIDVAMSRYAKSQ